MQSLYLWNFIPTKTNDFYGMPYIFLCAVGILSLELVSVYTVLNTPKTLT